MADTKLPTEAEIDAMHAREQAATPGPWVRDNGSFIVGRRHELGGLLYCASSCGDDARGEFIAHSRADVPRLISLGRAYYAQRRDMRSMLERLKNWSGTDSEIRDAKRLAQISLLEALLGEGGP